MPGDTVKAAKMFRDEHMTLGEISAVTGKPVAEIRELLVGYFGRSEFTAISRRNGGFRMFLRLKQSPRGYMNYRTTMKQKVSKSIRERMLVAGFRRKWRSKARRASKTGTARIMQLMTDSVFSDAWCSKCRLGGREVFRRKLGIHSLKLRPKRAYWSLKGLRRTGRKVVGPNGERMYNPLEVRVAEVLRSLSLDYDYEKRFPVENVNGFVSVDFTLKGNVLIEATVWDKPDAKSSALRRKFVMLKGKLPDARFIVVTSRRMLPKYRKTLGNDINVCCVKELPGLLLSTAG